MASSSSQIGSLELVPYKFLIDCTTQPFKTHFFKGETIAAIFRRAIFDEELRTKIGSSSFFFIKNRHGKPCDPNMKIDEYITNECRKGFIRLGYIESEKNSVPKTDEEWNTHYPDGYKWYHDEAKRLIDELSNSSPFENNLIPSRIFFSPSPDSSTSP